MTKCSKRLTEENDVRPINYLKTICFENEFEDEKVVKKMWMHNFF